MSRLQGIEQAIQQLTPEEFTELSAWIQKFDQQRWDRKLDAHASTDKLDELRQEALEERRAGTLNAWPPSS